MDARDPTEPTPREEDRAIAPGGVRGWRFPPRTVEPAAAAKYRDDGCTVFSDDARRVLGFDAGRRL